MLESTRKSALVPQRLIQVDTGDCWRIMSLKSLIRKMDFRMKNLRVIKSSGIFGFRTFFTVITRFIDRIRWIHQLSTVLHFIQEKLRDSNHWTRAKKQNKRSESILRNLTIRNCCLHLNVKSRLFTFYFPVLFCNQLSQLFLLFIALVQ